MQCPSSITLGRVWATLLFWPLPKQQVYLALSRRNLRSVYCHLVWNTRDGWKYSGPRSVFLPDRWLWGLVSLICKNLSSKFLGWFLNINLNILLEILNMKMLHIICFINQEFWIIILEKSKVLLLSLSYCYFISCVLQRRQSQDANTDIGDSRVPIRNSWFGSSSSWS